IYFGWLLFGIVIVVLFLIGARYADDAEVAQGQAVSSAGSLRKNPAQLLPLILVLAFAMLAITSRPLREDLGWALLLPAAGLLLWVLYRNFGRVAVGAEG